MGLTRNSVGVDNAIDIEEDSRRMQLSAIEVSAVVSDLGFRTTMAAKKGRALGVALHFHKAPNGVVLVSTGETPGSERLQAFDRVNA